MGKRIKVVGPPGTGKTTYTIGRIASFIREGYEPSSILAISFTRAARRAMREKVAKMLKPEGLIRRRKDTHFIGRTIHSVAKELLDLKSNEIVTPSKLRSFCEAYGYSLTFISEAESNIEELEGEYRDAMLITPEDYYLFFIDWVRHRRLPTFEAGVAYFMKYHQDELPPGFTISGLREFVKRYEEWKREEGLWDFTDFLLGVLKERLKPGGIRIIAVDEAQDLSPLLWEVVNFWAIGTEIFMVVGDPLQSIYEFSGGDPQLIQKFPATETVFLKQSHRVPVKAWKLDKALLTAVNSWYEEDYLPREEEGELGTTFPELIREIVEKQGDRSVFVLARTRALARELTDLLAQSGIPYVARRGQPSPFQSKEFALFLLLRRLSRGEKVGIEEMADLVAGTSIIPSERFLRRGAKTEMKRLAEENPGLEVGKEDLPKLGFNMEFLKRLERGEIVELMKLDETWRKVFDTWCKRMGEKTEVTCTVSTIHGVKGEEADTVILLNALTKRTYMNMLYNPQEEARVFHVAVTRTRHALYILKGTGRAEYPIPLREI